MSTRRINPWKRFNGAMVPNWLLRRTEVGHGAKLTYARLAQYAGVHGVARPKRETIATELGVSVRSLADYLSELEGNGLIESKQLGFGRANRYYFLDHPWMDDAITADDEAAAEAEDKQELQAVYDRLEQAESFTTREAESCPTTVQEPALALKRFRRRDSGEEIQRPPASLRSASPKGRQDKTPELLKLEAHWIAQGLGPVSMNASGELRGLLAAHGFELCAEGVTKAAEQRVRAPVAWLKVVLPGWKRERSGGTGEKSRHHEFVFYGPDGKDVRDKHD